MFIRLYHRLFPLPSPIEVAARELAEAKLYALKEQTVAEYRAAESASARSMVAFNERRIERLNAYINDQTKPVSGD